MKRGSIVNRIEKQHAYLAIGLLLIIIFFGQSQVMSIVDVYATDDNVYIDNHLNFDVNNEDVCNSLGTATIWFTYDLEYFETHMRIASCTDYQDPDACDVVCTCGLDYDGSVVGDGYHGNAYLWYEGRCEYWMEVDAYYLLTDYYSRDSFIKTQHCSMVRGDQADLRTAGGVLVGTLYGSGEEYPAFKSKDACMLSRNIQSKIMVGYVYPFGNFVLMRGGWFIILVLVLIAIPVLYGLNKKGMLKRRRNS